MKFKNQISKKKNKDGKGVKIIVTEQQFRRLIDRVVTEDDNRDVYKLNSLKGIQDGK
jgi:hypothetical protein